MTNQKTFPTILVKGDGYYEDDVLHVFATRREANEFRMAGNAPIRMKTVDAIGLVALTGDATIAAEPHVHDALDLWD